MLGWMWFIIQPLLTTGMFMFVFGNIAKIGTDGIPQPLFYFSGTVLWTGFVVTVSSLTTKYRDLKHLLALGVQLWMYATPVVYPLSSVPKKWRWVYTINPVAPVIETFRFSLLGKGTLHLGAGCEPVLHCPDLFRGHRRVQPQ